MRSSRKPFTWISFAHGASVGALGPWSAIRSTDLIVLNVARHYRRCPFEPEHVGRLNAIRPHLARACLISSRLSLRRVTEATDALGRVGIAAAAIDFEGLTLVENGCLNAFMPAMLASLRERLVVADPRADDLYCDAVRALQIARVKGAVGPFRSGPEASSLAECRLGMEIMH